MDDSNMSKFQAPWKSALTPQKAPTYGNQGMLIASPKELQVSNVDYVVVFEGTKKYHVAIADVVNPYTLHVVIPEHDTAEEVVVKVYMCQDNSLNILTNLKFTYVSQMEHAIAKFLAQCASDGEVAEKLDAVWSVCLGKDHLELWDKRLAQAFAQLELPIEWTLVGDILQQENESHETLLHFAARHGLGELIKVFLNLPGAKQALSTYNKSGLLPRDVARESGRLDIAELMDLERSAEQRKSGTFKDNNRRKVKRNNENGLATITNLGNRNIQADIQLLRELNKLKAENSPTNRHSWPVVMQPIGLDEYMENIEKELSEALAHGKNTKQTFIDDNLVRLRDIREEVCNLRSRNAEETSKELAMIADQNRRPAHSRRLSCPATVERRKRASLDLPNLKSRPESSASERSTGNQEEPTNPPETLFSTPPNSPPPSQFPDIASPIVTSPPPDPPLEDTFESYMTPPSNSPSSTPLPTSPMPISLKYSEVDKRPDNGRKGRPRTWYGGSMITAPAEDEELRRSNSLEDFAKALASVSDDDSVTSAASETNSKDVLQTACSYTEKESRTGSFVSTISDISVGKDSDVESERGDDDEPECTEEDIAGENLKAVDESTRDHDEINDLNMDVEETEEARKHQDAEGHKNGENGDVNEHEGIKMNGELDEISVVEEHDNFNQITAGSNVQEKIDRNLQSECDDINHEGIAEDLIKTQNESNDMEHECKDTQHECEDAEHKCDDTEHECKGTDNECEDTENEGEDTEHECKETEHVDKDTEHEDKESEHVDKDTEQNITETDQEYSNPGEVMEETEETCKEPGVKNEEPEYKDAEDTVAEQGNGEVENKCANESDSEYEKIMDADAAVSSNVDEDQSFDAEQEDTGNSEGQSGNENTDQDLHGSAVETRPEASDLQEKKDTDDYVGILGLDIGKDRVRTKVTDPHAVAASPGEDLEKAHPNDDQGIETNAENHFKEPGLELSADAERNSPVDFENTDVTQDLTEEVVVEKEPSHEDTPSVNSSEEISRSNQISGVIDDPTNAAETSGGENEDETKAPETEGLQRESDDLPRESDDLPRESDYLSRESENKAEESADLFAESEGGTVDPEERPAEFKSQVSDPDTGTDDTEDKSDPHVDYSSVKIQYEELNDIECEVKDFCLPGQDIQSEKGLLRFQSSNDVESGENSDRGKHIRFDEKDRSESPLDEDQSPISCEGPLSGSPFRQRSALLLSVKNPVKRTGSDVSVTSLQDVELNMHASIREGSISPGLLNASRKAKSYGDLSSFTDDRPEVTKDDDDESEEERRRIQEDHSVISRVKKFEQSNKYVSNENLDKIAHSRITADSESEKSGQRRWSNIFSTKNPKPAKKPGRTPTFRRDNLRSSMSSIGKGSKSSGKNTIESLVAGPHSAAFAKHSQTAPNLQAPHGGRPRSYTKDSPVSIRKSPSVVSSIDSEEQKPESPDDAEVPSEDLDLEVDSDLENFDEEPEAWSVTVEKDMLKKMKKSEIKRQDVILELIKTEGHHVRTLKIMQQVFYAGLNKMVNYPTGRLDDLFPRVHDLVDISSRFHRNLRCRQDEGAVVQKIGDVIVRHFSGDNAEEVKQAYGEFVSKHQEAVGFYKHYFKTDKKFSHFIKKCQGHRIVRRLSVPECFTLVTQRMTKYPVLIAEILKNTKSSSPDHKELQKALHLVKEATKAIDDAIKDYEKQSRLRDIKMRTEKGSVVLKSGQKIKNSRFVEYQSKMIHDGVLQWKNARGKLTETHVVLLESMVAFLQENDKKFSLLSIDGKSPCIALKTLMVREVATDKCAIYFVSTSRKGPEMYEFVCSSQKEKKQWYAIINDAISKAPEDTGELFHSPEEEKKLAEERLKRRNELLEIMKGKDKELSDLVDEKNKLVNEMKQLYLMADGNEKTKDEGKISTNEKARTILLQAINRTTQLTADAVLIRESHSDSELAAETNDKKASSPKRSETFGGFDRRPSQKTTRRAPTTIPEGKLEENHVARRDSGLSLASESVVGLNTLSQGQEVATSSSFQTLEALQWVLVQFSQQETALETLKMEVRATREEIKKHRTLKIENDKKQFLMKEEHQAELTRQKKEYSDLERTFNSQVSELRTQLASQQESQRALLQNFSELRRAFNSK